MVVIGSNDVVVVVVGDVVVVVVVALTVSEMRADVSISSYSAPA